MVDPLYKWWFKRSGDKFSTRQSGKILSKLFMFNCNQNSCELSEGHQIRRGDFFYPYLDKIVKPSLVETLPIKKAKQRNYLLLRVLNSNVSRYLCT